MPKAKVNKAFDWIKSCAESKGISHMVPEKFQKQAEAFLDESKSLTEAKKEIVRREANFAHMRDNFWFDLRKDLESKGFKDVFEKNIDFDVDAKKDGFLVVNLYDDRQGPPMGLPMRMPSGK